MNIMYEIKLMTDNSTWPGDAMLTVQYLTTKYVVFPGLALC